tara:strand:+ start:147 stop:458 length:312 start_codon:yes stop_codon:yes gene_type:complete
MAKQKPKAPKISTKDAIKTIATEINQIRSIISTIIKDKIELRTNLKDVAMVFDQYIDFKGDSKAFLKHIEVQIEEQKEKEAKGDDEGDEKPESKNPESDKVNS